MRKLGLRAALTMLVLAAVATTALLIHLSWNYTARRNVGDVVEQLNRHIVDTVHREFFAANYNVAWSTQEAVRSILADGIGSTQDKARRQSVFLSLLRSQPGLSWIALGQPNGDFIGVHRVNDGEIDLVSVKSGAAGDMAQQTIEKYTPDEEAIVFKARSVVGSAFNATTQSWYKEALDHGDMVPTLQSSFPGSERKALCFSVPLTISDRTAAVVAVVIDFDRLAQFLQGLQVGKTGTVVVLSKDGDVVAAAEAAVQEQLSTGMKPGLEELGRHSKLLHVLKVQLEMGDPALDSLTDPREFQISPPGDDGSYFINFSSLSFEGWIVATIIPGSDFLLAIDRNSHFLLLVLAVLTAAVALAAVLLADRLIALPLVRVTDQIRHIETFDLGAVRRLNSPLRELDNLSGALVQMSRGLASFQKYMPTTLVRTLVSQGIEARPGGHQQNLTVLFTDIAGFSGYSESLGDGIVPLLTDYLNLASTAILARSGTIDKFIGDAVMAFWGAPVANPLHAADACAAALDLQARLRAYRPIWQTAGQPPLQVRVGINSGRMLVGNIGTNERLNYTVIGDSVNIGSRLEALNKTYGTEILIGEQTRKAAGDAILVRRLDLVAVYGRVQGIAVYELLGMNDTEGSVSPPSWAAAYESGLDAYGGRDWQQAIVRFSQAAEERGGDRPSEIFIERCKTYIASPPPDDWNPLVTPGSK